MKIVFELILILVASTLGFETAQANPIDLIRAGFKQCLELLTPGMRGSAGSGVEVPSSRYQLTQKDSAYLIARIDLAKAGLLNDRVLGDGSLVIRDGEVIKLVRPGLVRLPNILMPIPSQSEELWLASGIAGAEPVIKATSWQHSETFPIVVFREGFEGKFKAITWNANSGEVLVGQFESPTLIFQLRHETRGFITIRVQNARGFSWTTTTEIPEDAILENYRLDHDEVTLTIKYGSGRVEIRTIPFG